MGSLFFETDGGSQQRWVMNSKKIALQDIKKITEEVDLKYSWSGTKIEKSHQFLRDQEDRNREHTACIRTTLGRKSFWTEVLCIC